MEDFVEIGEKARLDAEKEHELEELRSEFTREVPKEYIRPISCAAFHSSPSVSAMGPYIENIFGNHSVAYLTPENAWVDGAPPNSWQDYQRILRPDLTQVGKILADNIRGKDFYDLCCGQNIEAQIISHALGAKRHIGVDVDVHQGSTAGMSKPLHDEKGWYINGSSIIASRWEKTKDGFSSFFIKDDVLALLSKLSPLGNGRVLHIAGLDVVYGSIQPWQMEEYKKIIDDYASAFVNELGKVTKSGDVFIHGQAVTLGIYGDLPSIGFKKVWPREQKNSWADWSLFEVFIKE